MGKLIDETGKTYGYLTVIERAPNHKSGRAMWKCKCRCGNEVDVMGKHLRSGNTKSCGCYQRERATQSNLKRGGDLTNLRFGRLIALEEAGFIKKADGRNARLWKCQCDCGNICYIQHTYLQGGDTKSCGCIRSQGETEIEVLLQKNNIPFIREYEFNDLIDILPLRFDFAIFSKKNELKCLIEFQGEQHWQTSNGFYNEKLVEHDLLKQNYCYNHQIPLYYLYYKQRNKIQVEWNDLLQFKEIKEIIDELHGR